MRCVWLLLIVTLFAHQVNAQITTSFGSADASHFPLILIPMAVSDSGLPATYINATNFKIAQDGQPQSGIALSQCNDVRTASIVFVLDTSQSMAANLVSGSSNNPNYLRFIYAFSNCLNKITDGSEIALVEFAQSATTLPGTPNWFYPATAANKTAITDSVKHCFPIGVAGGTNLDSALIAAVKTLSHASQPNKYIIVISDDAPGSLDALMRQNNVSLYWMDVARDRGSKVNYPAKFLAEHSGGEYAVAPDTTLYAPVLTQLVQDIFSEHCTLQYLSSDPCPWWKTHQVAIDFQHNSSTTHSTMSFSLKGNIADTTPPSYRIDSSVWTRRKIIAYDPFPCQSGMWKLQDSVLHNFRRITLSAVTSDSATDSVIAIDSMSPASAVYIATDSMGSQIRINVLYHPLPDTNAPQIVDLSFPPTIRKFDISEMRPWDRGIRSIMLDTSSINVKLDSTYFFTHSYARVYLHTIDTKKPTTVCLIAIDSSSNSSRYCVEDNLSVAEDPVTSNFYIYPNPAHTSITISLPDERESSVEIADVLGNVLLRKRAMGELHWKPEHAEPAVYFVRVASPQADGTMSVSTQRVLFER